MNTDPTKFEFQPWLESIAPVNKVSFYIIRSGHEAYLYDLLYTINMRLENARKRCKQINHGYVFVTVRNIVIDKHRELKRKRTKDAKLRSRLAEIAPKKRTILDDLAGAEKERHALIYKAIDILNLRKRIVVKLRLDPDYKFTFKKIGELIGYSESTAREEFKISCRIIASYVDRNTCTQNSS